MGERTNCSNSAGKYIHPTILVAWTQSVYDRKSLRAKETIPSPVAWCNPTPQMPKSVLWCASECGLGLEFQDPKMELLYHNIRPYFGDRSPYLGLICRRSLQFRILEWPLISGHDLHCQAEASGSFNASHPEFPKELFKWWAMMGRWAGNLTGTKCPQTQSCQVFGKVNSWRQDWDGQKMRYPPEA